MELLLGLEKKWGRSPEPKRANIQAEVCLSTEGGSVLYDLSQNGAQRDTLKPSPFILGKKIVK